MKEIFVKKTETEQREEKIDPSILRKKSSAHSFSGWIIGKIKQAKNEENPEIMILLQEIYNKYTEFHKKESKPLIEIEILDGWKGVDKLNIYRGFENDFIIASHIKDKETGEVTTTNHTVKRENVNRLLFYIKKWKVEETRKCYDFAPILGFKEWKDLWRERQIYFNSYYYIIKILEALKLISYSSKGIVTRLK